MARATRQVKLYILRHGKAEERHSRISSDAKRRLTASGRAEMEQAAAGIAALGIRPDLVASSPLDRARETAEIVRDRLLRSSALHELLGIQIWPELRPETDVSDVHRRLAAMAPDSAVMIVGHEPHLSLFASSVITAGAKASGTSAPARFGAVAGHSADLVAGIRLRKGGLAIIRASTGGHAMRGVLRGLLTPKQLRLCRGAH